VRWESGVSGAPPFTIFVPRFTPIVTAENRRPLIIALAIMPAAVQADVTVSFSASDGGRVFADEYGSGPRDVILAHGGRYNKESWAPQARAFTTAGFHLLAIDFRGYGRSYGPEQQNPDNAPFERDVLAAAAFARANRRATSVAIVGASLGATAAGDAAIEDNGRTIDRVVLLSESPSRSATKLHVPVLFIVSRNDASAEGPRLPHIQAQYDRVRGPKKLMVLPGSAHGQAIFWSSQGSSVTAVIIRFLRGR
jgi:pimeloyl-ACP methyl ester carboxylesterase